MVVIINNKNTETAASNLQDLSVELNLPEKGVAIAINNQMVPRADWSKTAIQEMNDIIIIKAACGG